MTRRGFIKRIGGVAAGALAVASIPTAQIFQAAEVRITANGFQMYPINTMQDLLGIQRNDRTDMELRNVIMRGIKDGWAKDYEPMKIRNNPAF